MASMQDAIRRLTIVSEERGVAETAAKVRDLAKAQGEVVVASERSERATQSMEKRSESLQRRYDQEYRAMRDIAKARRDIDAAQAQGLITQDRAGALMQMAIRHHNGSAEAASSHGRALQELQMRAQGYAAALGPVGSVLSAMGPAGLAAAAGLGAVAVIAGKSVQAFATLEKEQATYNAVLKATQGAAGKTGEDIEKLATGIRESTGATEGSVRQAAAVMLMFQGISGDTFDRAMRAAKDLSVVMGGDMASAATTMARALEDPVEGLSRLQRAGIRFTVSQQQQIKAFSETGQAAKAQDVILAEVERRAGGAGKAVGDTLSGEFSKLGEALNNSAEALGGWLSRMLNLPGALRGATAAVDAINAAAGGTGLDAAWETLSRVPANQRARRPGLRRRVADEQLADEDRVAGEFYSQRTAGMGASDAAAAKALATFEGVVELLKREGAELAKTTIQREIDTKIREAQTNSNQQLTESQRKQIEELVRYNDEVKNALANEQRRVSLLGEAATDVEKLTVREKQLAEALRQGDISRQDYNRALEASKRALLENQIILERQEMFQSDRDRAIRERVRGAGYDPDAGVGKLRVEQLQYNETLKETRDLTVEFAQGLGRALLTGKNLKESLSNLFLNQAGKMLDKQIESLVNTGFKSLLGTGSGDLANLAKPDGSMIKPFYVVPIGGLLGGLPIPGLNFPFAAGNTQATGISGWGAGWTGNPMVNAGYGPASSGFGAVGAVGGPSGWGVGPWGNPFGGAGATNPLFSNLPNINGANFGYLGVGGGVGGSIGGVDMAAAAAAIRRIESGSFGGNYSTMGPITASGDRAYGAYQVMGNNVGPWSQRWTGERMTPNQFLQNPTAQDQVFQGQFGMYAGKYGNRAASAWFAGEKGMNNPGAADVLGTKVSGYQASFDKLAASASKAATSTESVVAPTNEFGSGLQDTTGDLGGFGNALSGLGSKMGGAGGGGGWGGWGSWSGGGGGGGWGGAESSWSAYESGGIVGPGSSHRMRGPASMFAGAPHFELGGLVGGARPIIAHDGEEVLRRDSPRHIANFARGEATPRAVSFTTHIDARGADESVMPRIERALDQQAADFDRKLHNGMATVARGVDKKFPARMARYRTFQR